MATDNYLKVRRPGTTRAVEFFFDSKHPDSTAHAMHAARVYAAEVTHGLQAKDPDADPAPISVWEHGVAGMGDFHCVGGCDICSPRVLEAVEEGGE